MNSKDMYLVHKGDTARTGGIAVINFIFLVIVLFPFFWLITTSFKPDTYITSRTLYWLPPELTFGHYIKVFTFGNLGRIFLNSVIVSFSTVLLSFIVIIPAAYALAILRPRGKGFISKFILSLQMLPGILLVIPLYMIMQKLHLIDTYRSLILSYTTFTTPFCFLLLSSYYTGLPIELFESAYIDGRNSFQALLRIALPLTAPGLVTVGTYSFLNA